ncbi:hypothetical protein Trydic_g12792 [Trypoxylus dichotomus]
MFAVVCLPLLLSDDESEHFLGQEGQDKTPRRVRQTDSVTRVIVENLASIAFSPYSPATYASSSIFPFTPSPFPLSPPQPPSFLPVVIRFADRNNKNFAGQILRVPQIRSARGAVYN